MDILTGIVWAALLALGSGSLAYLQGYCKGIKDGKSGKGRVPGMYNAPPPPLRKGEGYQPTYDLDTSPPSSRLSETVAHHRV